MAIEIPNSLVAYGRVNADGTKASGAGFTSKKTGAGAYDLTLDDPTNAGNCCLVASPYAAAPGGIECDMTDTSDAVKSVSTATVALGVATPADEAFSFMVLRSPSGV